MFRTFIQISSKQLCFLITLPTWVHGRGALPPYNPRCRYQRLAAFKEIMMSQEKFSICSFLSIFFFFFFFGNKQKLLKNCNFYLRAKEMILLNTFSAGILWKLANKKLTKNPTLNGYISKTRARSESELKLYESSLKILQTSLVFWSL